MLQKHEMVIPYLYKAMHENGNEITIFGSIHNTPLSALPQKLREFLLSFDVLMSESLKEEEWKRIHGLEQKSIVTQEQSTNREFPDWYDNMPLRVRQDLDAVFSTKCTRENVQYYLQSPDMINTLQQYSCLSYIDGMDAELLTRYINNPYKCALPIEGEAGYQATTMNAIEWVNNDSYENVMQLVANDDYYSNIANGGVKMSCWPLVKEYLSHAFTVKEYDNTVALRNQLWMSNVHKWNNLLPGTTKLLVGGVGHMEGQGGLLELLEGDGFTIEMLDLEGYAYCDMGREVLGSE
jgi:uncharacterized protein YbaP (TraB family)